MTWNATQRGPIDAALQGAVDRREIPGVVALATTAEEVVYEGAFGRRRSDGEEPLTADAVFQIMSMTKPVTSVATVMLIEDGAIGIDDRLSDYLADYRDMDVIEGWDPGSDTLTTRPANGPATIRHLLANTAGMGYSFCSPTLFSLEQVRGPLSTRAPLLHDPGARFTYSPATRVLGDVVAAVSGRPLETFFDERIFAPLGMTDTAYAHPDLDARLVPPHHWTWPGLTPMDPFPVFVAGDGGLHSTAADYARFLRCLLAGGSPLLRPETFARMLENQLGEGTVAEQPEAHPGLTRPFPKNAGRDTFGLGFQLDAVGAPGLRSRGSFSWSGLLNTHFWGDPARGVGGIVLMQVLPFYDPRCMAAAEAFERGVYGALDAG